MLLGNPYSMLESYHMVANLELEGLLVVLLLFQKSLLILGGDDVSFPWLNRKLCLEIILSALQKFDVFLYNQVC